MTVRMPSELLRGVESLWDPDATKHGKVVPFRCLVINSIMIPVELSEVTNGKGSCVEG